MPWEQLAVGLSYLLIALLGWVAKTVWDAVRELQRDLGKLREEIAHDYMPRIEVRSMVESILYEVRQIRGDLQSHEHRELAWHKETVAALRTHYEK